MNHLVTFSDYTLFLDRDGVINRRIPGDYVRNWDAFRFLPSSKEAIAMLSKRFKHILVVTNQQGIGKGLMTAEDLGSIHRQMMAAIEVVGGRIDQVYFCPELAKHHPLCRKPNPGMALQAKADFPDIDFDKSVMVGDSISDMEFGSRLGMKTVFIQTKKEEKTDNLSVDYRFDSLLEFALFLSTNVE